MKKLSQEKMGDIDNLIRSGKKAQVKELLNTSLYNVFKGTLPASLIEDFINSVDTIYYGE